MHFFKYVWQHREMRSDLKAFVLSSLAVVVLVTGVFTAVFLSDFFAGFNSEHRVSSANDGYVSNFEP